MLAKFKEMREVNNLVGQKVKAKREEIRREKIRKATGRETYGGIYKPITEGIESQKEELSELKALHGIKEQIALLPKRFVDKIQEVEQQQKLAEILTEPPPPELQQPLLSPLTQRLDDKEIDKILEDYDREKEFDLLKEYEDEETTEESEEELVARPKEKKIPTIDLDADLDTNVLEEYYKPSKMFVFLNADKSNPDKINKKGRQATINDVTGNIKSLNGSITGKSNSKKNHINKKK